MGKRDKRKAKFDQEAVVEEEDKASRSVVVLVSSDDDEANEDLSLEIIEKAMLKRGKKLNLDEDVSRDDGSGSGGGGVVVHSDRHEDEFIALEGEGVKGDEVAKEEKIMNPNSEIAEETVIPEEKDNAEAVAVTEAVEITDNAVLRKLLRGPRYFDPQDSSWGACFNCGEEGHTAANCTSLKRKKPCFVCGSLEHNAKQCTKGRDCYFCKKGGHRAKDCPEKYKGYSQISQICLKCGDSGHDIFSCKNDYSEDDLKEIQCYVCKSFGHLCCVNSVDTGPTEDSCYKCGQLGHTGLACGRLRGETTDAASPNSCYKCGEGGHFARECTSSAKPSGRFIGEASGASLPNSCFKCGEEGHFARECTRSSKVISTKASTRFIGEASDALLSSSCHKCGEEGHFARECTSSIKKSTRSFGEAMGTLTPSSCYNCGEEGHFARECSSSAKASSRFFEEAAGASTPSSCYKCGEEGHFARECASSAKAGKRSRELSTPSTKISKHDKDYQGFKTPPHDNGKPRKRKSGKHEEKERPMTTSHKWKQRGGWMTEDPEEFSHRNPKNNGWRSPATPAYNGHKISTLTSGHYSSTAHSYKKSKTSYAQGSAMDYRYSASRFGNSGGDGTRRDYNWW